jgi:hypothetical protein
MIAPNKHPMPAIRAAGRLDESGISLNGGWHAYPLVATETRRIKRRQTPGREWREVDVPRPTVQDQFAHRLAGRGRVEHAPDTVTGSHRQRPARRR